MIGKVFGLLAYIGSVSVGLVVTFSLLLLVYTGGYMNGTGACDSPALMR